MVIEFETFRRCKRILESYISTRRALLLAIIILGLMMYIGPSIFRWVRQKTPIMIDPNIGCIAQHLDPYLKESYKFEASVMYSYETSETSFLPYVGNGKVALYVYDDSPIYVNNRRSLSLPIPFHPVVQVDLPGENKQEGTALHYTSGIVYKFQCFSKRRKTVSVSHQFYAYRAVPSLIVQHIEISNSLSEDLTFTLKQIGLQHGEARRSNPFSMQSSDDLQYIIVSGKVNVPDSKNIVVFAITTPEIPDSIRVEAKSSKTLMIRTAVSYSDQVPKNLYDEALRRTEANSREELKKIFEMQPKDLLRKHVQLWKKIWHSGFGISYSRAQDALNGDKINATMYYVLSNTRDFLSEVGISHSHQLELQSLLYYPDRCYDGHNTLQASTLWSNLDSIEKVNLVVSLWLLTLDKQGCHNLLRAGAEGVMQAMILSFGSLKFSNHHLEFGTHPKDLHRDYYFRRISYGNSTHLNISVVVQEDNKALISAAVDRSDKDYYACDGGCLDTPVKLGSELIQFPVKLTDPVTAILYITSDRQHMEELKHTIHVKEVAEAPAHEHHIIALHRHGHQLGGLPALFWVSIAFLIVVFHLFLAKLVYNEYCGNQDKIRGRYVV